MKSLIHDLRTRVLAGLIPEGAWGMRLLGHRLYVGGRWRELGRLQFDLLVEHGLTPATTLLDIACGSLRGGRLFIDYLDPGCYLGIDQESELIRKGVENELAAGVVEAKRPEFVVSPRFEFDRFSRQPQMSLAFSLFSHLNADDIALCLTNLRAFVAPGHQLFATYFEGTPDNPLRSHSLDHFEYPKSELAAIGTHAGWRAEPIDDWVHPRRQQLMKFVAV